MSAPTGKHDFDERARGRGPGKLVNPGNPRLFGVLAAGGYSHPPQDAASGNPENTWRIRVLMEWT
jgi:hypothetical protein